MADLTTTAAASPSAKAPSSAKAPEGASGDKPFSSVTTEEGGLSGAAPSDDATTAPQKPIIERLQDLPQSIRTYLLSDEFAAMHDKIFAEHAVTADDRDLAYYTELQTFFGDVSLADFPDRVWQRLDWEDAREDKAAALVTDLLGWAFLPAQAFLGDVAGLIVELGGDLKKYPEKQIEMRKVPFAEGAKEIADSAAPAGLNEDMRRRLAYIVESRLRQVRDDVDVKEMLMKPKKTGGMELSEADAARIVDTLASKARMTVFTEGVPQAKPMAAAPAPVAESSSPQKPLAPLDIRTLYVGTSAEQEALQKRVDRLVQVAAGNAARLRDAFYQIIVPPEGRSMDPLYVVAGLLVMADGDRISEAVQDDQRFRGVIEEYLKENADGLAKFRQAPTSPESMNVVLQLLLRGVAGYDERESARFGTRIIAALKKRGFDSYTGLAAFDMSANGFAWTRSIQS